MVGSDSERKSEREKRHNWEFEKLRKNPLKEL